ncbi:unnamed protein product [Trichogramma brassicae]|uniref:Uncharacterized protein n=1 Tax=Trichogramma brassicae TaxID=86971 RepID=A0A6H5HY79_9HYME|nr:unnamed protein product [Trichogramma brassicae]
MIMDFTLLSKVPASLRNGGFSIRGFRLLRFFKMWLIHNIPRVGHRIIAY